uniref:Uncharacterized protein n=1 Tax=Megaselia scalaris TaxID=36166 RepID=T1H4Y6_MEGSC
MSTRFLKGVRDPMQNSSIKNTKIDKAVKMTNKNKTFSRQLSIDKLHIWDKGTII